MQCEVVSGSKRRELTGVVGCGVSQALMRHACLAFMLAGDYGQGHAEKDTGGGEGQTVFQ